LTAVRLDSAGLRVAGLGAAALVALASATDWSARWPLRAERMSLEVTAHRRGATVVLRDALPVGDVELRFSGEVPRPCSLFVFAMTAMRVHRVGTRAAPGQAVGPGPFQVPGGAVVDAIPGEPVRFVAVCGPRELHEEDVERAAWLAIESEGGGREAVAAERPLPTLPDGSLQASRLLKATAAP
jgi:hypothetical protein